MQGYRNAERETRAEFPRTPAQHAELLHPPASKGLVWLGRKAGGEWSEESWRSWELEAVLDRLAGDRDVYATPNRFKGKRRATSQVAELAALWGDVDFYTVPQLRGHAPEAVLEMALERLRKAGVPEPSLAICSGQGLQLVLQFTAPVRRHEIEVHRWQACQRRLYELLRDLGADRSVLHAKTLLRLAGTTNGKNGSPVYALRDAGPRASFADLAEAILPDEEEDRSAEVHDLRLERIARRGWKAPRRWSVESLWEARLYDFQTLRRLRYGEALMPDWRDRWLLVAGNAAAWLAHSPTALDAELLALAEEVGGWTESRSRSKLHAIFKRVRMAARGEKVEFQGFEWDPRYHFKTETLIDWLEVTPEEQREMLVLIGEDERDRRKLRRDRHYAERKRRERGARPRTHYDRERSAGARERAAAARRHRASGRSTKEIAAMLGVSQRTVQRWLA